MVILAARLEQELVHRPAQEELERRGILKPGGNIADARSLLEQGLNKIHINQQISKRPEFRQLIDKNIAYDANLATSLQANARTLERNIRSDRLNAALQNRCRPDMPADTVAPRLRSAQVALEQAMARDRLKRKLEQRPPVDDLIKNNIMKAPPHVASSLHAAQAELEKQMLSDRLNDFIGKRVSSPPPETVAPALQGAQRHLQRNLAKSNLYRALEQRPSPAQMQRSGLLLEAGPNSDDSNVDSCSNVACCCGVSASSANADPTGLNIAGDTAAYGLRSRSFLLTRTLLKMIANLSDSGELTAMQKGLLKDLVVDQDPAILAAADMFDADGDLAELKDTLMRLMFRR